MRKAQEYKKQRKPIIALVCEGDNKTESLYFNHFNIRENSYILKILPCKRTDPINMAKKAKQVIDELQLDSSIGDRVFCIVDLDLSESQLTKVNEVKKTKTRKKCHVEFILSNPCFEIWLLFYYTKYPKIEVSSQNVKDQLKRVVPKYSENYDIVKEEHLEDKHPIAINNAIERIGLIEQDLPLLEKNPYTEVQNLLMLLIE